MIALPHTPKRNVKDGLLVMFEDEKGMTQFGTCDVKEGQALYPEFYDPKVFEVAKKKQVFVDVESYE